MEEDVPAGGALSAVGETMVRTTRLAFHLDELRAYVTLGNVIHMAVGAFTLILFYSLYRLVKKLAVGRASKRLSPQAAMSLGKTISYIYYILITMYVLGLLGINLSAVWGAAGVAGVAIGFAAQTSASNLISGMFLLAEKSLKIGDFISVDDVSGTVDMIGLLSVNIHTPDNQMIRIPNSTILNENLVNYSHFPIRRLTVDVPLNHDDDLERAKEVAALVPEVCPLVLRDPAPLIYYDAFGAIVTLKICMWIKGSDLFPAKSETLISTARVFAQNGIAIPYDRRDIRVIADAGGPAPVPPGTDAASVAASAIAASAAGRAP